MKKSVLVLLAAGLCMMANGQNANNSAKPRVVRSIGQSPSFRTATESGVGSTAFDASKVHNTHRAHGIQSATPIKFGTMWNIIGVTDCGTTQASVNQGLNMITYTHREDETLPNGSGAYQPQFSLDGGNTWSDSSVVIFKGRTTRYPNGVIINPAGNATATNAVIVFVGPHTNGTEWDSSAYGSIRLNGTNVNEQMIGMYPGIAGESSYTNPIYAQSCDDSSIHAVAPAYSMNAGGTVIQGFYGAYLDNGVWSSAANMVTWSHTVIRPHLTSSAGAAAPYDSLAEVTQVVTAWSQDGVTGYVVFFGNLDSTNGATNYNYASYQPIVYKTTNSGGTWAMMPMFNFRYIPSLVKYLRPTVDSGFAVPFWDVFGDGYHNGHNVDATVDVNGNLHIFGMVEGCAIANPDSAGYTFNSALISTMYLYDVYTKTAGGWGADFLDSLGSPFGIYNAESPWTYNTGLGWGAQVQATRSTDGKKIFCTWLDDAFPLSQPGGDSEIISPVIWSIGIDVTTNFKTPATQFTTDGQSYFLQVSNIAYQSACGAANMWNIPCAIVQNEQSVNDGTLPVSLLYMQGVGFCDSQFTDGIDEVTNTKTSFSVSPNFPNPFTKLTSFNVTLNESSEVSVDVYNMVGQKVWSMSPETMEPGTHTVTLNAAFSAGVYFYRVIANGSAVTHKMVVE
jgi:hypothetical protein